MITLNVTTASGASLGSVTERAVGELNGPPALVEMLAKMMKTHGLQSVASLDGWSNGYLVVKSAGAELPGPAEDNRPRKLDGKFGSKGLPA